MSTRTLYVVSTYVTPPHFTVFYLVAHIIQPPPSSNDNKNGAGLLRREPQVRAPITWRGGERENGGIEKGILAGSNGVGSGVSLDDGGGAWQCCTGDAELDLNNTTHVYLAVGLLR
ncbi:hypothetical protein Hypma_011284 [Hypsizygus marmoreus]|uniref:Uncharacterized protein n=1 Tax=Hypsizygus marmoreus TaxID=39966 RepID=A0A369JML6_HYPMA|nr:hypothetical protein Hypma_011284 [Hypsizygus marmoreus]